MINFIKKLQSIDLNDLQNIKLDFDFSQFDFKSFRESLIRRKDILIDIILIVVTIFAVRYLFMFRSDKMHMTQSTLSQLEEKQKAAGALEKEEENLAAFKKNLPEGLATETEIIKTILGLAQAQSINVIDYTPADPQMTEYYSIQSVNFTLESSYAEMITLVRLIEKYKKNLRIDSLKKEAAGETPGRNQQTAEAGQNSVIRWRISVSSITVKYEK